MKSVVEVHNFENLSFVIRFPGQAKGKIAKFNTYEAFGQVDLKKLPVQLCVSTDNDGYLEFQPPLTEVIEQDWFNECIKYFENLGATFTAYTETNQVTLLHELAKNPNKVSHAVQA